MKNLSIQFRLFTLFLSLFWFCSFCSQAITNAQPAALNLFDQPLFRVVDLNVGEVGPVLLSSGKKVCVELVGVTEHRSKVGNSIEKVDVICKVDGKEITLVCANYNLPRLVGDVQIDSPITLGYTTQSAKKNAVALEKDARFRLWPAESPWVQPGTFCYPVKQKWFATHTQMSNEPVYVNAMDRPGEESVYYHIGLDFGGAEGLAEVVSATAGTVISRGEEVMPGEHPDLVRPRYDVVNIRDGRGWYYRYSHLKSIETAIRVGESVEMGDAIGSIGKEGGSGGWSHLHFDVGMMQPSGRYGIIDSYAFVFQAYCEAVHPDLIAIARPHKGVFVGEKVVLDATRSWHVGGSDQIKSYTWSLSNGETRQGARVECVYETPGHYSEVLKIGDDQGRDSFDIATVRVFDRASDRPPHSVHLAYSPTTQIKAGDLVIFKTRTFGIDSDNNEDELFDFGDGSPFRKTRSDGNVSHQAKDGYALINHRFEKPGTYIVSASRKNKRGETATARVVIEVGKIKGMPDES